MISGFLSLSDAEKDILSLASQGKTRKEIATDLGLSETSVRNRLTDLYSRTGLKNLHHACAYYGNQLGMAGIELRGNIYQPFQQFEEAFAKDGVYVQRETDFHIGGVHHPATLVSSEIQWVSDVRCVVTDELYKPPADVTDKDIAKWRAETEHAARESGQIVYEVPNDMLVVSRIEPETEFYEQIRLILRKTSYLTNKAIHENLERELKEKYNVDPFNLIHADLPLPLATSMHIVAGTPLRLIVARRGSNLGTYSGTYTAAVDALGQATRDVVRVGGESVFNIKGAMLRELDEERDVRDSGQRIPQGLAIGDRLRLLGLVYDYRVSTFILVGYLELPEFNAETICRAVSRAKEATYTTIPFPVTNSPTRKSDLEELCNHLVNNRWTPCASIGLVVWLKRLFGSDEVYPLLGQSIYEDNAALDAWPPS